jgi:hypothetical protein
MPQAQPELKKVRFTPLKPDMRPEIREIRRHATAQASGGKWRMCVYEGHMD